MLLKVIHKHNYELKRKYKIKIIQEDILVTKVFLLGDKAIKKNILRYSLCKIDFFCIVSNKRLKKQLFYFFILQFRICIHVLNIERTGKTDFLSLIAILREVITNAIYPRFRIFHFDQIQDAVQKSYKHIVFGNVEFS